MSTPTMRRFVAEPASLPAGTLVELFLHGVDTHDRPDAFLRRGAAEWEPISHREILADVRAVAHALQSRLGVRRGDRVAVLSENRAEWAIADYALLCIGALNVPLYATLPANQLAVILEDSGAEIAFASNAEQVEKLREVRAAKSALRQVIAFDDVRGGDVIAWADLIAGARVGLPDENAFRTEAQQAQPDDVATIVYTSGTTGTPKGVMLTHNNIYSNVVASFTHIEAGASDVSISFLPLSHSFQRQVDYAMFWIGASIAHVGVIDDLPRALTEVRPTIVAAVPRVYEKLYARILAADGVKRRLVLWARQVALDYAAARIEGRRPGPGLRARHALADKLVFSKVRERLGGRIRFFISGAAPLAQQIALFFYGAGVTILEGYGLTETSPVTNVNTPDAMRFGTVGKPIPGTEIMIADDGEILIRGPQIMKGYYRNEEATRAVIDSDGWFHTGDIGTIDEEGYLRITDRKKDLLVTAGGKNIAPQPLENAAKLSRFVAEAVMIGDRRAYPVMLVVPNFHSLEEWARKRGVSFATHTALVADERVRTLLEAEIEQRLQSFARYERPKKVLPLDREFSLERGEITPSMKVKRRVVEKHFADGIEALYAEPAGEQA